MIKKIIISVIAIVCLMSFGYVNSQAADEPKARVVINRPAGSYPIKIYMFYDTQAQIICYVTDSGKALQCFSFSEMSLPVTKKLKNLIKNYKTMNPDKEVPNILIIPGQ
ncbi:MAG: hypothetical protein ACTSX1_00635 [Candidatus Heimdallarchaeaceae archaeon]